MKAPWAPTEVLAVGHADAQGGHGGADAEEAEAGEAQVQAAVGLQVGRDRQGSARCPVTFIHFQSFSTVFIYFHSFSSIFIYFHLLLGI